MLGCQDFCGYYDWTFHYVRRRFGNEAVEMLWRMAIGGDSQKHYSDPAAESGLLALYRTWVKTGGDEHCDWTFTLDEEKNVLRWDMRECPSKGFLIQNDRNADEDYCNHCMGWIIPMLQGVGAEIVAHEHNHCGQCWAVMRMKDRPSQPLDLEIDIRKDARWKHGYLDRWANDQLQPLDPALGPAVDPCEVLEMWFRRFDAIKILAPELPRELERLGDPKIAILASDAAYNDRQFCPEEPTAVLIGSPPSELSATAARYLAVPVEKRPLLMHAYLPSPAPVDFLSVGLPRPIPILPLLIRKNEYAHQPGNARPTVGGFLAVLAAALGKKVVR
jgi:hypothetical protein